MLMYYVISQDCEIVFINNAAAYYFLKTLFILQSYKINSILKTNENFYIKQILNWIKLKLRKII